MSFNKQVGVFLLITSFQFHLSSLFAAQPDLTKGGKPEHDYQWNLGATGAKGWFWNRYLGGGTDSSGARQILITEVAPGSPAYGKLQKGDVILGVKNQKFTGDVRHLFMKAVMEAEQEESQGKLQLLRWRGGKTDNIELQLQVMGTYSPTAPYDCPKSKRVFEKGCDYIARVGFKDQDGNMIINIEKDMNALALLASGRKEYLPALSEYAEKVASYEIDLQGLPSWEYAFNTLFLAEYVLATHDEKVIPGLKRLSLEIANGISGVGTWGHGFARPSGGLGGYGCMNIVGIPMTLSMVLAREAGINDPALDKAIAKSSIFLRQWVNKGTIPYGDHQASPSHEDNGKCSAGGILFDLLGDKDAARYYSRCGTAAYHEKEGGHCGNFFNILWALPGVSRSGPAATSAYFRETAWYYDMSRSWDGRCEFLGFPGEDSYVGWDCTGSYLLGFALPLKSLYLTGRKPSSTPVLTTGEIQSTIAAGRDFTYVHADRNEWYENRNTDELLKGLSSWSPAERYRSARALRKRDGDFNPQLQILLKSQDQNSVYGACMAIAMLGSNADSFAPQLLELLKVPDTQTKMLAARALTYMGPEVRRQAVPELLKAALVKSPDDPRNRLVGEIATCLFTCFPGTDEPTPILSNSLEGVDRPLLYSVLKQVLANEDGLVRGLAARIYPMLNKEDVKILLPDIVAATAKDPASGEMFRMDIRWAGLNLLAKYKIYEGMDLCVDLMNEFEWGCECEQCLIPLKEYGAAAKVMIPRLKQTIKATEKAIQAEPWNGEKWQKDIKGIQKLIKEINSKKETVQVQTIKEFTAQ